MTDNDLHLTDTQYLLALERLRAYIAESSDELVAWDSEYVGDKDTECSWGLCTCRPEQWPADTRLWPDRELTYDGRVYGVKYRAPGQNCPFDRQGFDNVTRDTPHGCFYRCRVFSPEDGEARPSRDEAIQLYDTMIARLKLYDPENP
jgi:hypothetical protein